MEKILIQELDKQRISVIGSLIIYPDEDLRFTTYHGDIGEDDTITLSTGAYRCTSAYDVTTDEEFDEGLSYDEVRLTKIK